MRKVFIVLLLIAVVALTASPVGIASTIPDKILKTRLVTADEVLTTGGGWLVYSFRVYAAAANAYAALYNCDTLAAASDDNVKAENGEPDQYELSNTDAIGDWPIEFDEGLTVAVGNGYAIIQYED